jgi:hypothetical protein
VNLLLLATTSLTLAADPTITAFVGTGERGYSGDGGPATKAKLDNPFHLVFDKNGNLFFSDTNNGSHSPTFAPGEVLNHTQVAVFNSGVHIDYFDGSVRTPTGDNPATVIAPITWGMKVPRSPQTPLASFRIERSPATLGLDASLPAGAQPFTRLRELTDMLETT